MHQPIDEDSQELLRGKEELPAKPQAFHDWISGSLNRILARRDANVLPWPDDDINKWNIF